MKTVHFLTSREPIPAYTVAPVRHNRQALRERGYEVRLFHKPTPACLECDVLCLVSKPLYGLIGERRTVMAQDGPTVRFLQQARRRADAIVLMDDSDSTSVTHFELLPHIDLYLKKQLFRDRALYRRELYGGRLFSDFYHRRFGIEDSRPFEQFHPLPVDQEHKVAVSWNIGLADMFNAFRLRQRLHRHLPNLFASRYTVPFVDPGAARPVDIFLRTSADLGRETVSFHRQEMLRRLARYFAAAERRSGMVGDEVYARSAAAGGWLPATGDRLPSRRYRDILAHTKVLPSPFGWGELGVRDYEALIHGGALLKPDMTHMQTWPNIFVPNETYLPIAWDFGDLDAVLDAAIDDERQRTRIAAAGQDAYRDSISAAGMARFCDRFAALMRRATDPRIEGTAADEGCLEDRDKADTLPLTRKPR